jgi:hypothetical protein
VWLGQPGLAFREARKALGASDGGWAFGVTLFDVDDDGAVDAFFPAGCLSPPKDNGY